MWLVIIAFVALANIMALLFLRKRLLNAITYDSETTEDVKRVKTAGWKTVGVYSDTLKFKDTKAQYTVNFVFMVNEHQERKIDFFATPPDQQNHIKEHYYREQFYLLYMIPWQQGSISLEELVRALPKVKTPLVITKS
jgi:hypothetical protein